MLNHMSSRMTTLKAQAPAALVVDAVPLHLDSLLSPVDSSFLKGASALARFGLDIGGTLCKVVFFEPEVDTTTPRTSSSSRLSSSVECANGYHETASTSVSEEDGSVCKWSKPMPTPRGLRQARKMWVSSHDPVHIPGRGTLYFKCFGMSPIFLT